MRIAEMLEAIANWLESPNNEAILLSEYDEKCLEIVASSCVEAAAALKKAAATVDSIEPVAESNITPESLEDLATLASAFDMSGDVNLKKQASVIDELLLTLAAPPGVVSQKKAAGEEKIDEIKKKYQQPRDQLAKTNKVADSEKDIDKSNMTKNYRILEAPLEARYCPSHAGAQLARVGDGVWQCDLDKQIYNFETGYTLENGDHVPGGSVSNQTQNLNVPTHAIFDSRYERLLSNK